MNIIVRGSKADFEGTAYVAVYGDVNTLRSSGIGETDPVLKVAYLHLKNPQSNKECGAIIKSLSSSAEPYLEIDSCLLHDLSCNPGSTLIISPLKPLQAKTVRLAISKTDYEQQAITNLCKTYFARHPLSSTQKKPIYLFTGEKVMVEILAVEPGDLTVLSEATELVVDVVKATLSVAGLDDIGGLSAEKKLIRERILLPILQPDFFSSHGIRPPRGILLCGPPGCGKTMIARALSAEINANFVELSGAEAFNMYYGESEKYVREIFEKAREKTPAIILIDEIDAIGGARSSTRGELERRMVTTLLTEMDGLRSQGNVIVVATTNLPDSLDPALRRPGRFDYEIQIGVPNRTGRLDILKKLTKRMQVSDDLDLNDVARRTHGFVGADLMLLCRESAFEALSTEHSIEDVLVKKEEVTTEIRITKQHFENALKRVKASALREFAVEVPTSLGWKEVGGLTSIKETIIEEIVRVLKEPEAFEAVGITPVKGILFYGPPGTGKTLLARVIANEAEANFISVKGPEMLSKWFGESEQHIRSLFRKARESSPCIIFFDEIDAISGARGKSLTDGADRVVNQLLTEMDGFESSKCVMVIAATNRVEMVDPALLRPGRFDYQILVPLPNEPGLEEIYRIHLRSKPLGTMDVSRLAKASLGFSGAHVAEVCRRAALSSFRQNNYDPVITKVEMRHLQEALELVRQNIASCEHSEIGFSLGKGD